jgi:hypothetical protein
MAVWESSPETFLNICQMRREGRYLALGSNQYVRVKSPWFGRAAKHAYELCCDALDAEGAASENDRWRKVFGRAFPRRKVDIMEARLALESHAADAAPGPIPKSL